MTAKFKNKQSKRRTCHLKYKVEKKIRQHHKKSRREAKKKPATKRKQKPLILPNAELLAEVVRKEEIVQQIDLQKKQIFEASKEGTKLIKEAEEYLKDHQESKEEDLTAPKQYRNQLEDILEKSDVIIQVLDARDPMGSRSQKVEQAVLEKNPQKRLLFLLTKIDLAPKQNVTQWLEYFKSEAPTVPFKASQDPPKPQNRRTKVFRNFKLETCVGPVLLEKVLNKYKNDQKIKTPLTIGVVGLSKVGKTSFINSLIAAYPNATKVKNCPNDNKIVQLTSELRLINTPALVQEENTTPELNLLLRNCTDPVEKAEFILSKMTKEDIRQHYKIFVFNNNQELFQQLARNIKRFKPDGEPSIVAGAKRIENDWLDGRIKFSTSPEELKEHLIPSDRMAQNLENFIELDERKVSTALSGVFKVQTGKQFSFKAQLPLSQAQHWLSNKMDEN